MIFNVNNVSFAYKMGNTVFENVSFAAKSGEVVALLGANGSGKTTLLKCLMGYLPLRTGEILLNGENIAKIPPRRLWQKISYVPQARRFESSLDVRNMILLGCASRIGVFSSPGERENRLVDDIADRLGIAHLLEKKCSEISGGELQMTLIARALASEPELLILDEPESNLDFRNQLIVLDTVSSLSKDGMTCILSTHYPDHALNRADKSLLLTKDGAIFGKTREIVTRENIRHAFGVDAAIGEVDGYSTVIPTRLNNKV